MNERIERYLEKSAREEGSQLPAAAAAVAGAGALGVGGKYLYDARQATIAQAASAQLRRGKGIKAMGVAAGMGLLGGGAYAARRHLINRSEVNALAGTQRLEKEITKEYANAPQRMGRNPRRR